MKLLTIFELASRSDNELQALYRDVFNRMARYQEGSIEKSNARATLENIRRVRCSGPKGP